MNKKTWILTGAATILAASMAVIAADMPTTMPGEHATTKPVTIKLVEPYSKLDGLSDVQKSKLAEIEKKSAADIRGIREQARADSREVLTDEQKAQLDKMSAEKKEETSEKYKTKKSKSTTTPAE